MSVFELVRGISAREAAERAGLILTQRGARFWTRCPVSGERTASLCLYEGDRGFNCFSCGVGGDAVRLYAHVFELSPLDAARKLAADFGLQTDGPPPKPSPTVYNLRRVLERFRASRLEALQEARALAAGVCRCRAAADGPEGAWLDVNFTNALRAQAEADVEIERLECAGLSEIAERMAGHEH